MHQQASLLILILWAAGLLNRRQQQIIELQNAQIKVLLEQSGKKRLCLTDRQRRLLAVKAKRIGRKELRQLSTIVTPDTLLRWHRKLVAKKWSYSNQATGRPRTPPEVEALVLQMAKENSDWGYRRITGNLKPLGYKVSPSTVANILRKNGIEPAPDRPSRWKDFLRAHWGSISSMDFTTVEVWTRSGLTTFYVLVVMHLHSRKVHIAGVTEHPNGQWIRQVCRNLTDIEAGFLKDSTHLILDRDRSFLPLREYLESYTSVELVVLPPRSPNLNAHIERFMRSLKHECLNRMIFFGRGSLDKALREYLEHYHHERPHQGIGNVVPFPQEKGTGEVQVRKRLGGLLKHYRRAA